MTGLDPSLTQLALSAAQTVVTAMASDAWPTIRRQVATILGKGDKDREEIHEHRLESLRDETSALSVTSPQVDAQSSVARLNDRFQDVLMEDPDTRTLLIELVKKWGDGALVGQAAHLVQQRVQVKDHGKAFTVGQGSITIMNQETE